MKKVGTITESRMLRPAEPKSYPLVSDALFGGKVKIEENAKKGYPKKGVKGGTKAAAKIAKAKKVGNAKLLKDADGVLSTNQTQTAITKGGASMGGYNSQRGNTENPDNEKVGGQMTDAKTFKGTTIRKKLKEDEKDPPGEPAQGKAPPMSPAQLDVLRRKKLQQTIDRNERLAGRHESKVGDAVAANAKQHLPPEEINRINQQAADLRKSLGPVGGAKAKPKPKAEPGTSEPSAPPVAKKRGTRKAVRRDTASAVARPHKPLTPTQARNVAGNEKAPMDTRTRAAEQT